MSDERELARARIVICKKLWAARKRCTDPGDHHFSRYGGRGITFGFSSLREGVDYVLDVIGPPPAGKTLDRIDNERGYEPGNLRWATRSEQAANKTVPAEKPWRKSSAEVVPGLNRRTYVGRLRRGWSKERALGEPVNVKFASAHLPKGSRTVDGVVLPAWLAKATYVDRLKRGWSEQRAISEPLVSLNAPRAKRRRSPS